MPRTKSRKRTRKEFGETHVTDSDTKKRKLNTEIPHSELFINTQRGRWDQEQFQEIYNVLTQSALIISSKIPRELIVEIAEYGTGNVHECINYGEHCDNLVVTLNQDVDKHEEEDQRLYDEWMLDYEESLDPNEYPIGKLYHVEWHTVFPNRYWCASCVEESAYCDYCSRLIHASDRNECAECGQMMHECWDISKGSYSGGFECMECSKWWCQECKGWCQDCTESFCPKCTDHNCDDFWQKLLNGL